MCGRYTLVDPETVLERFRPDENRADLSRPRYNVAPGQNVPVLVTAGERRVLCDVRWGLVPHWAKGPAIGNRLINARAETVAGKPAFRDAFRRRRCLVAADGFYEWPRAGDRRPYYFRIDGGALFAFAGLYEVWRPADGSAKVASCALITTRANEAVAPIHDRMPVILDPAAWPAWLDPDTADAAALGVWLVPFEAARMEAVAVSRLVNSPSRDEPACIRPQA